MSNSIHHLPGRLRVRMGVLRRNPQATASARRLIETRSGILHVDANHLTGSVLVHYDPDRISAKAILDVLAEGGFRPPRDHARPADRLADTVVSLAMERLVERGAAALLAAII